MTVKPKSIGALFVALIIILAINPLIIHNIYNSILGKLILIGIVIFFSMNNVTLGLLMALVIIIGLNLVGTVTEGMTTTLPDEKEMIKNGTILIAKFKTEKNEIMKIIEEMSRQTPMTTKLEKLIDDMRKLLQFKVVKFISIYKSRNRSLQEYSQEKQYNAENIERASKSLIDEFKKQDNEVESMLKQLASSRKTKSRDDKLNAIQSQRDQLKTQYDKQIIDLKNHVEHLDIRNKDKLKHLDENFNNELEQLNKDVLDKQNRILNEYKTYLEQRIQE